MNGRFVATAALALVVLGGAWMFRYDAKNSGYGTLLVTDRWTGERLSLRRRGPPEKHGRMREEVLVHLIRLAAAIPLA